MWAENRFIIFIPVPNPDFRQLRAADPQAGRVGYKKAKRRSASAASPKIMRLLRSLFLRPAIPSASQEALVPERAYLRTSASVLVANTALHRLPHSTT